MSPSPLFPRPYICGRDRAFPAPFHAMLVNAWTDETKTDNDLDALLYVIQDHVDDHLVTLAECHAAGRVPVFSAPVATLTHTPAAAAVPSQPSLLARFAAWLRSS